MSLLNYTTEVATEKTVTEIQRLLTRAKATAVLSEYQDGILSAISFRIQTAHGLLSFRLPANVQQVYVALCRDQHIGRRFKTKEQAARVAWRIVKDWLAAQLAFIESGQAELTQLFLHCAQDPKTGETVYEQLIESKFSGLLLPEHTERQAGQ